MRVIGGTYRSRRLVAPHGMATRPTSDRLRETLFNVLAPHIEGATFVDLYAGSGAVGIEALSRGAATVSFVEHAAPAVKAIRENLSSLGIASGFQILSSRVAAALPRISPARIIFLDPPYAPAEEYDRTLQQIAQQAERLLLPGGWVIAEHDRKSEPAESYGELRRFRVLQQGDAGLSFYQR